MNDLDNSEEELGVAHRRPRVYRPRQEYLNAGDFRMRFRLMPWQAELLLNRIGAYIEPRSRVHTAMSARHKLMAALRFYASNGFYYFDGDAQGYSKDAVSNAIKAVTSAICQQLFPQLIQWPTTLEENQQIEYDFYCLHDIGMAGICGAIDGSLIKIKPPKDVERYYVDRNHDHSLNLTAVCDAKYVFRYINASFPGSVSDARVLRASPLARRFNQGWRPFPNAAILGDSIYPTLDWLIPMRAHPPVDEEAFYRDHARLRRVIECAFGVLKNRFYVLSTTLRVKDPQYASQIIKACCALHNFLIANREPNDPILNVDIDDYDEEMENV